MRTLALPSEALTSKITPDPVLRLVSIRTTLGLTRCITDAKVTAGVADGVGTGVGVSVAVGVGLAVDVGVATGVEVGVGQ